MKWYISFSSLVLLVLSPLDKAAAEGGAAHQRLVHVPVRIMHEMQIDSKKITGSKINSSEPYLDDYLNAVKTALPKIDKLYTGLNPSYVDGDARNPACKYDPKDDLSKANLMKIGEFPYLYMDKDECMGTPKQDAKWEVAARILGALSKQIDWRAEDAVMCFRPTNSAFVSKLKSYASDAYLYSAGALAIPFYCAYKWIIGDDCDSDDVTDVLQRYNPIEYVDSWIPGIGPLYDAEMFSGVWHHIYAANMNAGKYNKPRGVIYNQSVSAFDIGIMAFSDLFGLTLDAYTSEGDNLYGQYDEWAKRTEPQWQFLPMGDTEFSPVDNLGRYGADEFAKEPSTAKWLAWPLHTLGDAVQAQHVDATTGHGHKPLEDFTGRNLDKILYDPMAKEQDKDTFKELDADAVDQYERIIAQGFFWWKFMNKGSASIQSLVEQLALASRMYCKSWDAYKDWASTLYTPLLSDEKAIALYDGSEENLKPNLENGAAAILAYLVTIANLIPDDIPTLDTNCPDGEFYWSYEYITAPTPDTGCPERDEAAVKQLFHSMDYFIPAGCYSCTIEPQPPVNTGGEIYPGIIIPAGPGGKCESSADCQSGLICQDGVCKGTCSANSDCNEGLVCSNGKCAVPAGGSCESSAECEGGTECNNGICQQIIIK